MQTNPPMLPPPDHGFPIVSRVLGFDSDNDAQQILMCGHPRVKDTNTLQQRLDDDVAMEDAPYGSNVAQSEDASGIDHEYVLWNTSFGGCKDALPTLRSYDDDEDDSGHGHQGDVHMSNHVSIGGVGCGGASHSNPAQCSRHGNKEPQADKEGDMTVDLVDEEVDPDKAAMRDHSNGGCETLLHSKPHSCSPNIPHNEVCILFTYLFNFRLSVTFQSYRFFITFVRVPSFPYSSINKN
jgi:hypothetical protein